jgi:rRNA biogenesis protein RRP5
LEAPAIAIHIELTLKAAEEVYKKLVKKFGVYSESWLKFAEFYLKKENIKAARELLPRSLKSLDKAHRMFLLEFGSMAK